MKVITINLLGAKKNGPSTVVMRHTFFRWNKVYSLEVQRSLDGSYP